MQSNAPEIVNRMEDLKMNIEIYPLEKVVLEGGAICLGMEQSMVETVIGKGHFAGGRYFYYDNEMALYYDNDNRVEFIEFLSGIDGTLQPKIGGISVFEANADEVFELLKKCNGDGKISDVENGYSYSFLNISVGIYREAVPEAISEMMQEAADSGSPLTEDAVKYEMRKANHWATIGVGRTGYFL